jgi:hypothetical protein
LRDFVIDTSWSPNVAAIELRKSIQGAPPLSGGEDALFSGRVANGRFRLTRKRTFYRSSFFPVIEAVVEPSWRDGARVRVRMRLHLFVMTVMCVWIAGATFGAIAAGTSMLSHGQPLGLVAVVFPLLGVGLVSIPFAIEATRAERTLREIFARAPPLPAPPETGVAYR